MPGLLDSSIEISKMFSTQITKDSKVKPSKASQNLKDIWLLTRKGTGEISKAAIMGEEINAVLNNFFLFITSKITLFMVWLPSIIYLKWTNKELKCTSLYVGEGICLIFFIPGKRKLEEINIAGIKEKKPEQPTLTEPALTAS